MADGHVGRFFEYGRCYGETGVLNERGSMENGRIFGFNNNTRVQYGEVSK